MLCKNKTDAFRNNEFATWLPKKKIMCTDVEVVGDWLRPGRKSPDASVVKS